MLERLVVTLSAWIALSQANLTGATTTPSASTSNPSLPAGRIVNEGAPSAGKTKPVMPITRPSEKAQMPRHGSSNSISNAVLPYSVPINSRTYCEAWDEVAQSDLDLRLKSEGRRPKKPTL